MSALTAYSLEPEFDLNFTIFTLKLKPFAQLIAQRYRYAQRRYGLVNGESSAHARHSLDCSQFRIPTHISGQGDLFP